MQKLYLKQLFVAVLALLCSVAASAYDLEVDGIYYNILSISDLTVEVTYGDKKYSGEVVIPSTVSYKSKTLTITSIGNKAFYNCSGLTNVTIPNSVTSIGDYTFYNCISLKDLRIEDGETTLSLGYNSYGVSLFYDCPLESLYLGRNIQYETGYSSGYSPFFGNKTLKSVTIGNSVTSIGSAAFYGCSGLTSVIIPNSVTSIGNSAFEDCSGLTSVTIGNSVTSIGDYAFNGCSGLTSVVIPNSVTSIGERVFQYCSSLTSVTIGNSVTSIGNRAFEGCSGLTSVTIGNSVTSIGGYAFAGCSGLTSVHLLGETPTTVGSDNFTNKQYINMIVYVPKGTLATYQAADTWKNFWDIQEFDVTAIENIEDVTPAFEITSSGIQLTAAEGKAIAIYAANGALVEKIDDYAGEEITLDKGVYIVRVGDKTMKVRL